MSLLTFALLCSPSARAQGSGGYPGGSGSGGSGGYPGGSGGSGWVAQPAVVNGVTYPAVVTGTINSTFTDANGNVTQGTGDYHNDGMSPPPLGVHAGESLTYKVNGTVVYTWKWNGGPNNVPPPSIQYVHEWATASASGGGDINGTVTVTAGTGAVGKEKSVSSVSDDGKSQSKAAGSGGEQWVRQDGSSGTITVTGTVQAECDLSEPKSSGGYPGGGYPGGGGSGSLYGNAGTYFQADLRNHCEISSPIETSYEKTSNPETQGRDPHVRNPDGSIHVESSASWNHDPQTGGAWIGSTGLFASSPFDTTNYSWSGDAIGDPNSGINNSYALLKVSGAHTDEFPKESNAQVTVTDLSGSGSTDSNTYAITWHLPYEKNALVSTKKTKHVLLTRMENIQDDFGGSVPLTKGGKIDVGAAIDGIALLVEMSGQEELLPIVGLLELVGKMAEITKWEYEYADEQQETAQNNATTWGNAETSNASEYKQVDGSEPNIPAYMVGNSSNYKLCRMAVKQMELDKDEVYTAYGFNLHGYDGCENHLITDHKIDNVKDEFFFTVYQSTVVVLPLLPQLLRRVRAVASRDFRRSERSSP